MSWYYEGVELTEKPTGYTGFVYRITNTRTGRIYLGQKIFDSKVKKAPLKGMSRARRSTKETWIDYYGSSDDLKEDIRRYGKDNFHREILRLCESKAEMNYYETKYIMVEDAVLDPKYYNKWVSCKAMSHQLTKLIAQWTKLNK